MSKLIPVKCLDCGHEWHEDLEKANSKRIVFRGAPPQTRTEKYLFTCPQCGSQVVVKVTVEE